MSYYQEFLEATQRVEVDEIVDITRTILKKMTEILEAPRKFNYRPEKLVEQHFYIWFEDKIEKHSGMYTVLTLFYSAPTKTLKNFYAIRYLYEVLMFLLAKVLRDRDQKTTEKIKDSTDDLYTDLWCNMGVFACNKDLREWRDELINRPTDLL